MAVVVTVLRRWLSICVDVVLDLREHPHYFGEES